MTSWKEEGRNSYGKTPKKTPRTVREEDIRLQELKDRIALAKLRLS